MEKHEEGETYIDPPGVLAYLVIHFDQILLIHNWKIIVRISLRLRLGRFHRLLNEFRKCLNRPRQVFDFCALRQDLGIEF